MKETLYALLASQGKTPQPGYTFSEMASLFNVTEQSIRLYVKKGKLRAWKTSPRKWGKVPQEEVERFFLAFNSHIPAPASSLLSGPLDLWKASAFTTEDVLREFYPPAMDRLDGSAQEAELKINAELVAAGFTPEGEGTNLTWHWVEPALDEVNY